MPDAPITTPATRQAPAVSRPAPTQTPAAEAAPAIPPAAPVYLPPAPVVVPAPVYQQQNTSAPPPTYTPPSSYTPYSYPAPTPYTPSSPYPPQSSSPFPSNNYSQAQTVPPSTAGDQKGTTREKLAVSVVAGPLFGGTLGGEYHPEVDTSTTGMVRLALDGYLVPQFSMGTYLLYTRLSPESGPDSVSLWAIGGTFKGCFGKANSFQFRPGLALAYQYEDAEGWSSSKGFGVAGIAEVAFPLGQGGLMGLAQLSFISQPAGGNDDIELTFAPMVYVAAGLEFGK